MIQNLTARILNDENYLSLFSGVGGGDLAFQHLLDGFRCIGYVDNEEYCQKVLAQRIRDGFLDNAPIFTDIKAFLDSGHCKLYKGITDLVTAGLPCQPFSVAGKRKAKDDERNMWPATLQTIEEIRPGRVFLENVPGLLGSPYFKTILLGLFEAGYDAEWMLLSASDCGANHKRERLWIVAYSSSRKEYEQLCQSRRSGGFKRESMEAGKEAIQQENGKAGHNQSMRLDKVADTNKPRFSESTCKQFQSLSKQKKQSQRCTVGRSSSKEKPWSWWEAEPRLGRMADGVAHRLDRLKAIGNGQVSIVAAAAWNKLVHGISPYKFIVKQDSQQ